MPITSHFPTGGKPALTAIIEVNYTPGAVVTCAMGGTTYTAPNTSGKCSFKVYKTGTWVITATKDADSTSTEVVITTDAQFEQIDVVFEKIYGITRNIQNSSPEWARTDDAVGFEAVASVGTTAGHSDFDNCYPWSGMVRETLPSGDVMVKIPKFWFKRYRVDNDEYIKIADKPVEGFKLHPAFNHAGVECDYIYVGAYKTSASGTASKSGVAPAASMTRAAFRTAAKGKGNGWSMIDISTVSAIEMLYLVEYAHNNSQAKIGRGYCDGNSAALNTGSCNNVPGLTGRPAGTDGKTDVVYRGIEGFWGNIYEFVDGCNANGTTIYVCNDLSKYADDTSNNYTALSYAGASNGYITVEGLDTNGNEHIMLPTSSGGSDNTYYCDYTYWSTGWRVFHRGGNWAGGSDAGLFCSYLNAASSGSSTYIGSRLLKIPS